jgi:tight adherence protein B
MAMTAVTIAALAFGAGAPAVVAIVGVAAVTHPVFAGVGIGAWALVRRRSRTVGLSPDDEAAFLGGMAAELAAGAPPRSALVAAASRAPRLDVRRAVRLAAAGMGADRVAAELGAALPTHGRLTAAAWSLTASAGGPAATMFEMLAVRAADEAALRRERRALTAQARASAAVVAGLPLLLLVGMAATGRLRPGSDPALGLLLVVGVSMQAAGLAVVWTMLRRVT